MKAMSNNALKNIFILTDEDREKVIVVFVSIILFTTCILLSLWIMPENCYLYEYRQVGFLCDGIDLQNPQPCPVCRDERAASIARILLGLGFGLFFLPFIFSAIRNWRNHPIEQTKLFD